LIREGQKLSPDAAAQIPELLDRISKESENVGLYAFGSLTSGDLKSLSDLDFGLLVSRKLDKQKRFDKRLDLIGVFTAWSISTEK
jgi:predicted nucleotidyltransferase